MWECPDFFELDEKNVLIFSPQGINKKGDLYCNLHQTGYLVGKYDYENNQFTHGSFNELDNGHDFYAAQTFLDDKERRIAIGWMDMWESDMITKQDGWCGALTLPRVLRLGKNNKILMNPVEELKMLRESEHNECINKYISDTESYLTKSNDKLMELKVVFDLNDCNAKSFGVKFKDGKSQETLLTYNLNNQKLILDCSKCGKEKDGIRKALLEKTSKLFLQIFLDRSSIEIFINNGEATLTSRIYPKDDILQIEIFAKNGDVRVEEFTYWTLKDIWK